MALLSSSDIDRLYRIELEKFRKRIPKSISMHSNGKKVMPNGVPMTWMVGYYDHPPIFMDKGEGAYRIVSYGV